MRQQIKNLLAFLLENFLTVHMKIDNITVLYNAVININRFLFVVKYGNCQGRFFKYAFCFHLEWIPAPC